MTKVKLNPIIEGLSGQFGDIVFRQTANDGLILSHKPDRSGVIPTPDQLDARERFRQATVYGRMALADPTSRALYDDAADKKGKPVFALMVADFLNAPLIDELDVSEYTGAAGSPIYIRTHDDFMVQGVKINIADTGGTALEAGEAAIEPGGTGRWVYNASTAVDAGTNVRIIVTVTDRPGGSTVSQSDKTL